jgi:hypothetical protein
MADVLQQSDAPFVRIELDGVRRKLRFKHRDLRDAVNQSGKSIGALFMDPFGGWPYLLLYGLRWQDLKLTLDKCSDFLDQWVEEHGSEATKDRMPLDSMGEKILEALNKSGFVKIRAEGQLDDGGSEGNEKPEADSIPGDQ